MEPTKSILEKIIKIILIASAILGILSEILLFKTNLYHYPVIVKIYPLEIILLISMTILFLIVKKNKMEYLKLLVLIGIILACINLFGFYIFLSAAYKHIY